MINFAFLTKGSVHFVLQGSNNEIVAQFLPSTVWARQSFSRFPGDFCANYQLGFFWSYDGWQTFYPVIQSYFFQSWPFILKCSNSLPLSDMINDLLKTILIKERKEKTFELCVIDFLCVDNALGDVRCRGVVCMKLEVVG